MYEDICAQLGRCLNPTHDHGEGASRLSRLIDADDPAFDHIAQALTEMSAAGVQLNAETIKAAVKLGHHRFRSELPPVKIARVETHWRPSGHVVYYIRRGNMVKIGTTKNLRERLNGLMPDEVLAIEPGGRALERERHAQFADLRSGARSEYFFPGVALQRHIAHVRAEHGTPPADLPTLKGASRAWTSDLDAVEETAIMP